MIAEFWDAFTKAFETGSERANNGPDAAEETVEETTQRKIDESTKKVVDGLTSMGERVNSSLETVFNWVFNKDGTLTDNSMWFGTLALLIILLDKIAGVVTSFKNKSNDANSIEGVIRVGIEAFMVVLAFCAWVSKLNEAEFKQTEQMIDKIMPLIEKILGFYKTMKVFEFIGDQTGSLTTALGMGLGGKLSAKWFGPGPGGGGGPAGFLTSFKGFFGNIMCIRQQIKRCRLFHAGLSSFDRINTNAR
jgi:hypothetical protein